MAWKDRISFDIEICHGKACFKGTRVLVSVILESLADSISYDEILEDYPSIHKEDIDAALDYAATLASEIVIPW